MQIPDINVLVGIFRKENPLHELLASWLETTLAGEETVGLTPSVVAGYVRIVTNPRIFQRPTPLDTALGQIDTLRRSPDMLDALPGPAHWGIFAELCQAADARGNLVSDAHIAAVAIEHGATVVSLDRDFARFPRLKWRLPNE